MSKKKLAKYQLWKKVISGTISLSLFLSFFPTQQTNAYNVTTEGNLNELKEWVEKYQSEFKESAIGVNPIQEGVDVTTEESQSIIVQFKALPEITSKTLKEYNKRDYKQDEVENEHEQFNEFLTTMSREKSGFTYTIDHSYFQTYNGVAMSLKGTDIPKLLESNVVSKIWPDSEVKVDPINIDQKVTGKIEGRMATSTPLIGVDKLREEGLTGKGIKVGVIDTGIDYNHPDLKDNYKGGYDIIDNDNDPMETTYEDWKNSDQTFPAEVYVTSHGTHVAGTIAANGKNTSSEFATTGIAPEADLYGYRVLGPTGMGTNSDIIAGIEKAVEDDMDVINLSLGSETTDTLFPTSIACNNAVLAGIVTVVANGNSGPKPGTMAAPASAPLVISVGASTTDIALATYDIAVSTGEVLNGIHLLGKGSSFDGWDAKDMEIVYGGLGYQDELENLDLKDKILVLDRGELSFFDKFTNAKAAGAVAVIMANNEPGDINLFLGEPAGVIPGIAISQEDGVILKEALGVNVGEDTLDEKSESPITVKINKSGVSKLQADKLADFSSRGPASDGMIKPDIVAPGVGILSTYPYFVSNPENPEDYSEAYSRIDGTSMASPHIAGVAALMLQDSNLNNKNLEPHEVKINMMNSAEKLALDYDVNAAGAGRINAYAAVHTDIEIKVLDKAITLDGDNEKVELDYITGSLSFDRVPKGNTIVEKELPMEIMNKGDINKKFNVTVEYHGEEVGANNAGNNGVHLSIENEVSVEAGSKTSLTAKLVIPETAVVGQYEGYVTFTNAEDSTEDYRIPFAVKYLTPGFEEIEYSRPAVSNDLEMMHFIKGLGIDAYIQVSSPLEKVDLYIKDYETKERIGYVGKQDISYLPAGFGDVIKVVDGRASYFPMDKDGKIEYIRRSLFEGKYTLEIVGKDLDNDNEYFATYDFLVDNQDVKIDMEIPEGLYEVTKDMYTVEEQFGEEHSAFWLKGNLSDNSTTILQEMGYDVDSSDLKITGFTNGMPRISVPIDSNGDFKFGIEKSDLDNGMFEFSPMPTDIATSQNLFLPPRYFLVNEGASYFGVSLDKDVVTEGENITATMKVVKVAGSTFSTELDFQTDFEIMDIRPSKELQDILDAKGYKAVITKTITGVMNRKVEIELSILDNSDKKVEVSGDLDLLDIEFKFVSDNECEFYREYLQSRKMIIKDSENKDVHNFYAGFYEGVDIKPEYSTLKTFQAGEGEVENVGSVDHNYDLDKYYWVEDSNGNKYDVFFHEDSQEYRVYNLPITEEELTLVSALPGHFKKIARFVPSRMVNDELRGKVYYLLGSEYYSAVLGGDVNGDGLIDVNDAIEIEKFYGENVDYNNNPADINFDGVVDAYDMDYVVYNFGKENEQIEGRGTPATEVNGRTLEDILKATGYADEIRLEGIDIDKPQMDLEVGETDKINAVISPGNVPGIKVLWSSDNEKVATVDSEGNVTAIAPGYARITIETNDGRLRLKTYVNVTKDGETIGIDDIVVEEQIKEVYVGDEFEFEFKAQPYESLVNEVNYVSAADSIVSIKDGKGIANKPGKVFVTADINSGQKYATWEITVLARPVESIKLSEEELKLNEGEEAQLEVIFDPNNATNKNVTWKSSDESVATVVDGKVVAVKKGEAEITVTTEDGGHTATCKVTVEKKETPKPEVALKSINLNKNKLTLDKGAKEQLKVTFKPEDATNKNVTWKSSNEKVAKVVNGEVVAIAKGVATITVTSEEGKLTDTCKVTVKGEDGSLPQTGAVAGASMALAMGAVAVGAGVLILKRKRDEE